MFFRYLPRDYELAQWHRDVVLSSDAFKSVQSFFLVSRQHVVAGTLRQPLQITHTHRHTQTLNKVPAVALIACVFGSTAAEHTKQRMAKMKSGIVDRASSQRQPNVGMTRIARSTSNTVPRAQNT